jgi:hypothetical protein
VIGVAGKNPFGADLEKIVAGKTIESRSLQVKYFGEGQTPSDCQILFISSSEKRRLPQLTEQLRKKSILTVGDMDGFMQQGGMILLKREGVNVRFEVNLPPAEKAGLKLSSKLLQVARGGAAAKPETK